MPLLTLADITAHNTWLLDRCLSLGSCRTGFTLLPAARDAIAQAIVEAYREAYQGLHAAVLARGDIVLTSN
jgi:hypothetical protein